jgi:predicted amidohydrolase
VHHKYELYSDFEKDTFTAGTSIEESLFDTPAGKAGMLICSDIHCAITGLQAGGDCSQAGLDLLQQFADKRPRLVLVSNYWFVSADAPTWGSITVGATLAKSMGAYVATANTTKGDGYGGAIYDPEGNVLAKKVSREPSVVYAEIPLDLEKE